MEKKRCRSDCGDKYLLPAHLVAKKDDLIQNILVRLPVVSLLRFKSICKSWHTLIQTSSFIDLHTTTTFNSSSSHKFGSFIFLPSDDEYSPENRRSFRESALVMLSSSSDDESQSVVSYGRSGVWRLITSGGHDDDQWSSFCYQHDYYDDRVFKVVMDDNNKHLLFKLDSLGFPSHYKLYGTFSDELGIIGSCNGLLCLYDRNFYDVSLCNPATRQFRLLPTPITPSKDDFGPLPTVAAFGFDVETKDYKVVLLTAAIRADFYRPGAPIKCLCRVEVYSLRTNSWKLLEQEQGGITSLPGYPFSDLDGGISLNGSCFFLAKFFHSKHRLYFPENNWFIISFDFTKEIFIPIQLPEHHQGHVLYLSCLGGKLALFIVCYEPSLNPSYPDEDYSDEEICGFENYDIWVLNEQGNSSSLNKESWTLLKSFEIEHEAPGQWNLPIGISDDGEFALLQTMGTSELGKKMKLYNLATEKVKKDFLSCQIVSSKANAYKPSLVSIIGGNCAAAAASDRVMSAKKANKKVTLKSFDGDTFAVDEVVAVEFQTIKHMIKDDCADNEIPVPYVTSKILAKVIEYCKKHVEGPKGDEDLQSWDAEFVKVDLDRLLDLMWAACYLGIKSLMDLIRQPVADMIKGRKTPSHRRKKRKSERRTRAFE